MNCEVACFVDASGFNWAEENVPDDGVSIAVEL